jgi:hypothetical protein
MGARLACFLLLASLVADSAWAAEPDAVRLAAQLALGTDVAAFPRVAVPDGPASQRINQALAKADGRLLAAAKECRGDGTDANADANVWTRSVTVVMRGVGYLAMVADDAWDCGGAHPDTGQFALAYDMRTGTPLNWERLLPKALLGTASLDTAGDGTQLGVVASPALKGLYVKLAKPDADCGSALRESDLQFLLWPDAARDGVAMAPSGLPHVIAACGADVVIPVAMLRTLGVASMLVDAIATAHKAGLFGPTP